MPTMMSTICQQRRTQPALSLAIVPIWTEEMSQTAEGRTRKKKKREKLAAAVVDAA